MNEFEMEIVGVDELVSGLSRLGEGLSRPAPALNRMANYYADRTKERMTRGGDPRYPDILPASRKKRKVSKTTPALWDSGGLIESATATRPGVADSLYSMTPDGFTEGTARPGAMRHQKGFKKRDAKGRRYNEPARPFLVITKSDEGAMAQISAAYVDDLTKALR
ncbi:MAG: phage virion morphogenesis protein [Capsulimonas sp.]|uniref:phage virion morphogenesis protein n=1 Tax=Capsulimonas sp. TaxID=2494211 RepID=UPI003265D6BD